MVDCRINGIGQRLFFSTQIEAETTAETKRTERKNSGLGSLTISDALRVEALDCAERLKGYGRTLREAVDHFIVYLDQTTRSKPIADIVREFIADKVADGAKKPTIQELQCRTNHFCAAFGDRHIATVTQTDITDWLRTNFVNPVTRNNTRKVVVNLFNFAVNIRYAAENPASKIKKVNEGGGEVRILTPTQVENLLKVSEPAILPYFAIAAFAGIRPEELLKMKWEDVLWKQGIIRVREDVSKVKRKRNVPIETNLVGWLSPYKKSIGSIRFDSTYMMSRQDVLQQNITHLLVMRLQQIFIDSISTELNLKTIPTIQKSKRSLKKSLLPEPLVPTLL